MLGGVHSGDMHAVWVHQGELAASRIMPEKHLFRGHACSECTKERWLLLLGDGYLMVGHTGGYFFGGHVQSVCTEEPWIPSKAFAQSEHPLLC